MGSARLLPDLCLARETIDREQAPTRYTRYDDDGNGKVGKKVMYTL